jgi:hypothetical protein
VREGATRSAVSHGESVYPCISPIRP